MSNTDTKEGAIVFDLTPIYQRLDKIETLIRKEREVENRPLTIKEVAVRYDKSIQTIRSWAEKGKIPATQDPGGSWIFFSNDLEEADKKRFK